MPATGLVTSRGKTNQCDGSPSRPPPEPEGEVGVLIAELASQAEAFDPADYWDGHAWDMKGLRDDVDIQRYELQQSICEHNQEEATVASELQTGAPQDCHAFSTAVAQLQHVTEDANLLELGRSESESEMSISQDRLKQVDYSTNSQMDNTADDRATPPTVEREVGQSESVAGNHLGCGSNSPAIDEEVEVERGAIDKTLWAAEDPYLAADDPYQGFSEPFSSTESVGCDDWPS